MLLSAEHLSINFGSRQILQDVNFYLNDGDKVGVIGINGTGKSTFLRVLCGAIEPDSGTVSRDPNVQVSVLTQNPEMDDDATVLEQVFARFPAEFRQLNEYEAVTMLTRLGITDFSQKIGTLSGGQRKRQSILRTEREWIMRGCQARSTKSRERIERYENLKNQAAPETDETLQFAAASASRLGKKLISLDHVSKSFGEKNVIRDFSYSLLRDDRIGIVGDNGAGKSTLLHMFAGELTPDSGTVDMGSTVKIGHFSQEGRELDLNQRVYDFIHEIGDSVRTDEGVFTAKAMMERFLFPSDLQSMPIGRLSGGERRRLYLLSVLMSAPNVLLLDEPTNDLDVMTLSILEDYLESFPGPILVVSHDRFLLDKLSRQIFEVRSGQVLRYSGNWSDWQKQAPPRESAQRPEKPKAVQERPRSPQKLKFSFREQREYETIDGDLAALETQLQECLAAQSACGSDYVKLQELTEKQKSLEAALEEKTQRWMYLQELKEKIDAQ